MTDVGLFIVEKPEGRFELDIRIGEFDLEGDDGAETAMFISLFSNQRVTDEERPFLNSSKAGWWGDVLADVEGDQIGSKLWTLDREKVVVSTLEKFINAIEDSLQWMIDDEFTDRIDVDAVFVKVGGLKSAIEISIDIFRPDITEGVFRIIWDGQDLRRA